MGGAVQGSACAARGKTAEGYLPLAHLDADEYVDGAEESWTRGLLIRRHRTDGELAYFSTWCPADTPIDTPIDTLVAVEGRRWSIQDAFETAKNELGLDHNAVQQSWEASWHGWHRHVSLVMLAFAVLAVTRCQANVAAKQTLSRLSRSPRSSAGRSRRPAALPPASHSAASIRRSSSPGQPGAVPTRSMPNAPT